jgi:chloride channel 3/4/5
MTSSYLSPTASRSHSVSRERRNSRRPSGRAISPIDPQAGSDHQEPPAIPEEINEIKRYEDFTTIDWVQDAVYEQSRRRAKRRSGTGFWDQEGILGWRRKVYESYDAGQAWLVVTLVGMAIGLNSAVLNIITEWLSDIKLGHCTTAFYLNESFCCWGAENGRMFNTLCNKNLGLS